MADRLLLEDGSLLLLEDGSAILLEVQAGVDPEVDPTPYRRLYALDATGTYALDSRRSYRGT